MCENVEIRRFYASDPTFSHIFKTQKKWENGAVKRSLTITLVIWPLGSFNIEPTFLQDYHWVGTVPIFVTTGLLFCILKVQNTRRCVKVIKGKG